MIKRTGHGPTHDHLWIWGYVRVSCTAQMYSYALSKADELGLSELEKFDTRTSIRTNFLMALVPMVSVVLSIIFINSWLAGPLAGFVYFLYTPIMFAHGRRADKKRKALIEELRNKEEVSS
jgi:hypothetical protein